MAEPRIGFRDQVFAFGKNTRRKPSGARSPQQQHTRQPGNEDDTLPATAQDDLAANLAAPGLLCGMGLPIHTPLIVPMNAGARSCQPTL